MIESITYRWEFRLLRDTGRYRRSGPLGLRSAVDDGSRDEGDGTDASALTTVRVGYAIGRTVGNAVVRNRIRRRLREVVREIDRDAALRPARHLVIVSPRASSATFDELRHHLRILLLDDGLVEVGRAT